MTSVQTRRNLGWQSAKAAHSDSEADEIRSERNSPHCEGHSIYPVPSIPLQDLTAIRPQLQGSHWRTCAIKIAVVPWQKMIKE